MKILNKILLIASLGLVVFSFWSIVVNGYSSDRVFSGVFFGICILFFVYEDRAIKWLGEHRRRQIETSYCKIMEDHFYFPKNYYYRHGLLKGVKKLPFSLVDEIRMNTWPICAKVNNNELIFLFGLSREEVAAVAEDQGLSIVEPQDNWFLLLEEFLDTEFGEKHKQQTLSLLETVGIDRMEVQSIRRKFKIRMLLTTMFSMEWVYYGQFDILRQIWPLTADKYWWTMELALREKASGERVI